MHIIFNPPVNEENKYIETMVRPLQNEGYKVHDLDSIVSGTRHFRSIRLVHLNWFENVDDADYLTALKSFIRKTFVLSMIRMSKKKLVWTMHNRISHEKKTGRFSRILTEKLIQRADIIIIHCEQSRKILTSGYKDVAAKIRYLPHPDYIGTYGPVSNSTSTDNRLKLLFIGTVKPYKNIELLIRTVGQFGQEVDLTIAGNPRTKAYKEELIGLATKAENVNLMLEFIPDIELPVLMGNSDLLILPYNMDSSLNSGTVILAFSYQKTVICPEIGTLADMKEMKENFLTYQYGSENEHMEKISTLIHQAILMKKENSRAFDQMGLRMYDYIREKNNKSLVGEKLKAIYSSILR